MTRVTVRRGLSVLFIFATILASMPTVPASGALAGTPVRVALPEGTTLGARARPVTSLDGTVGFVAPALGETIVAFEVRTGTVLGTLVTRGAAIDLSLDESGSKRLLAVTHAADAEAGLPATVTVVDATVPTELSVKSTFSLPEQTEILPSARAELARGQKFGVVPVVGSVDALVSFDVETGKQVGALVLDARPDRISVFDGGRATYVAVVGSKQNEIVVATVGEFGEVLPASVFALPEGAGLADFNNVGFDAAGRFGYVAAYTKGTLFSFSLETGEVVDQLDTEGLASRLAVSHRANSDRIAVVNVSSPNEENERTEPPKRPSVVFVDANEDGKLALVSRFTPRSDDEITPANNPDFSADGRVAFVPAHSGALYEVDVATGEAIGRADLEPGVESIASAPLAAAVVVAGVFEKVGRLDVVPVAASVPKPEGDDDADRGGPPAIDRLTPRSVIAGRRRDVEVTAIGSGFAAGAVILVGSSELPASVGEKGKRASFILPAAAVAEPGDIGIKVRNPDATVSNEVAFTVDNPFTPAIKSVKPDDIPSGRGSVKLQIAGDHFRKDASVWVAYTDDAGQPKTETLKSKRHDPTAITAVLPKRLTVKGRDFNLTVNNGDGGGASTPATVKVFGPIAEAVTPTNAVAGKKKTLVVHVKGRNFHRDVRVFIKSPHRDEEAEGDFREVDRSRFTRRSGRKLVVKLPPSAYRYSGKLVLRIVNPVQGPAKGDEIFSEITVEGPVVETVRPETVFASNEPFVLKLSGKRFRPGASVILKRDAENAVPVRVGRGALRYKSETEINIRVEEGRLLELFSTPGSLAVRVVNPNGAKGDPSARKMIAIVGPTLTEYDLFPSNSDPQVYRLILTGTNFREGVTAQLLSSEGEPFGLEREVTRKSSTELVVLLKRSRVQQLRTFRIVVLNPGDVRSNVLDVMLR